MIRAGLGNHAAPLHRQPGGVADGVGHVGEGAVAAFADNPKRQDLNRGRPGDAHHADAVRLRGDDAGDVGAVAPGRALAGGVGVVFGEVVGALGAGEEGGL